MNIIVAGSGNVGTLNSVPKNVQVMTANGLQTLSSTNVGYDVSGSGSGHNLGMSQWGAYAMAQAGKTAEEIVGELAFLCGLLPEAMPITPHPATPAPIPTNNVVPTPPVEGILKL